MSARKQPDTFVARLKALRLEAGVSVTDLAARAGLSRTYLHRLESGDREPGLEVARRLAHALGLTLAAFDGG